MVDNRFRSYIQDAKLVSGDRGAATQESRLQMTWSSFRDEQEKPVNGVLSKTIVRYTDPFDLRFSGYLVVNNDARPNDQFVYLNARRRVRRVNLREEAVFGTDFTFEDIIPARGRGRGLHAPARRGGRGAARLRGRGRTQAGGELRVLEVRDPRGQEELRAVADPLLGREGRRGEASSRSSPDKIKDVEGVHWPMELTMKNLQLESFTTLVVEDLKANPKLERRDFDLRRLESH